MKNDMKEKGIKQSEKDKRGNRNVEGKIHVEERKIKVRECARGA
jgi:hypothetical protein